MYLKNKIKSVCVLCVFVCVRVRVCVCACACVCVGVCVGGGGWVGEWVGGWWRSSCPHPYVSAAPAFACIIPALTGVEMPQSKSKRW